MTVIEPNASGLGITLESKSVFLAPTKLETFTGKRSPFVRVYVNVKGTDEQLPAGTTVKRSLHAVEVLPTVQLAMVT